MSGVQNSHGPQCTCGVSSDLRGGKLLHKALSACNVLNTECSEPSMRTRLVREHDARGDGSVLLRACRNEFDKFVLVVKLELSKRCDLVGFYAQSREPCDLLHLYASVNQVDADNFEDYASAQTLHGVADPCGNVPVPLYAAKFKNVRAVTFVLESGSPFSLEYLNLIGVEKEGKLDLKGVVFELMPEPSSNKLREETLTFKTVN